jgi:hypothetical protein
MWKKSASSCRLFGCFFGGTGVKYRGSEGYGGRSEVHISGSTEYGVGRGVFDNDNGVYGIGCGLYACGGDNGGIIHGVTRMASCLHLPGNGVKGSGT